MCLLVFVVCSSSDWCGIHLYLWNLQELQWSAGHGEEDERGVYLNVFIAVKNQHKHCHYYKGHISLCCLNYISEVHSIIILIERKEIGRIKVVSRHEEASGV